MPITKLMMAVSASITKIENLGLQNKILNVTSWLFCIMMMVSRMVTTIRKMVLMRIIIVLNRYTKMQFLKSKQNYASIKLTSADKFLFR